LRIDKPSVRVQYVLHEVTKPDLGVILVEFLRRRKGRSVRRK
jgi:hypothetical protein